MVTYALVLGLITLGHQLLGQSLELFLQQRDGLFGNRDIGLELLIARHPGHVFSNDGFFEARQTLASFGDVALKDVLGGLKLLHRGSRSL